MQPPRNYQSLNEAHQKVAEEQEAEPKAEKSGPTRPQAANKTSPQWAMEQDRVSQEQSANAMIKRHAEQRAANPQSKSAQPSKEAQEIAAEAKAHEETIKRREQGRER
jgi:hypothetical protein